MEFDVKKYFPRKEGFGDTVLSIPEMQAEIARLQAEVERTNDVLESQAHVIRDLRAELDTAWNDAIEAAAQQCCARRDLLADAEKRQIDVGLSGRDYYGRRLEAECLSRSIHAIKRPT